jgi:hypothetical protein
MSTEFPYLQIDTPEKKKLVGKQQKGTRIYRREGTYKESGEWCIAIDEVFNDKFVSPGGVRMFVPSSRAAVHKRLNEGRLTAFCFHVVHDEKTFFGNIRKAKATPFVYIPVSECVAWAKELEGQRGEPEPDTGDAREFLMRDPEDRKNRKVRYTDKYFEKDQHEYLMREMKENAEHQAKKKREEK